MQLEGNTLNCYHFVNSLIEVNVSIGLLNVVITYKHAIVSGIRTPRFYSLNFYHFVFFFVLSFYELGVVALYSSTGI